jgi:hypothetical protein
MGAVYLAEHQASGRTVALKVLLKVDERRVKRFEREAEAMQRLAHPGVVSLVVAGRVGDVPYLAMEYVEGGDLEQALEGDGLTVHRTLEIVSQAAHAVAHAHEHGILHRDLKPANILIDTAGNARVTDFGLAKILDHETRLTRTNATVGTPYYMAPEQIRGGEYTGAVDTYALGVILYTAATGEYPFDADDKVSLFRAILGAPPTPPTDLVELPKGIGPLILWALEKDPADRPTCTEFGNAIDDHLAGRAVRALTPSRSRRQIRLALATLVALGFLAGLGGIVIAVTRRNQRAARQAQAESWLKELREAISKARRARSGRGTAQQLRELVAHRDMSRLLKRTPESLKGEAEDRSQKARARQRTLFQNLIPTLVAAGRSDEALALADERIAIEGDAIAPRAAKLRAMAAAPERAPAALRLAEALIAETITDTDAIGDLAHGLLALHRPELAKRVLADAPDALRLLRAEAHEANGDYPEALADIDAVRADAPKDVPLAVSRVRLQLRMGTDPLAALNRLDRLDGGAVGAWHAAKALALQGLGRTAAARTAWREAVRLEPTQETELPQLYLRLGYRKAAEALLTGLPDPASRLDLTVSRWLGGAGDEATLLALRQLAGDSKAARASVALGASAERWAARVELARGQTDLARAAAERAQAIEPDARSGATLAAIQFRSGALSQAQATLDAAKPLTQDGERLAARLALERDDASKAQAKIQELPADLPARFGLALEAARRDGAGPRRLATLADAAHTAYNRSGTPGRPSPVPIASLETGHSLARVVDRLCYEARLLRANATRGNEALKLRSAVLLKRAQRLDPYHLGVAVDLAQTQRGPEPFAKLIAANPNLPIARRYRIAAAGPRGRTTPQTYADLEALIRAPTLEHSERALVAAMFLNTGRDDQAWQILKPALADETRNADCTRLAVLLATRGGDTAQASKYKETLKEILNTYQDSNRLFKVAFYGNDQSRLPAAKKALRQLARDLPLGQRYWNAKAQAWFGQGGLGRALMCGGEYLVRQPNLWADGLSLWIHFYGWTPEIRAEGIFDQTAERVALKPRDGAPWLGQALFFLARYNLSKTPDPEDLDRATASALHGVHLAPESSGALALAADTLVSAGEVAEARPLIVAALTLAPRNQYATLQHARVAASEGDAKTTVELLRTLGHLERPGLKKLLRVDPVLGKVRGTPEFQQFLESLGG